MASFERVVLRLEKKETELQGWLETIEKNWQNIPEFEVGPEKLQHLAIICDGDRRAARERGLRPFYGHRAGLEVIKGIARAGREWGIRNLSFWVWSTENWKREKKQVSYIMGLAARFLPEQELLQEFLENRVKFKHLGRKDRLPDKVRLALEDLEKQTADCDQYFLNLAMDYGGLDETARAVGRIFEAFQKGEFNPEILKKTPQAILGFLDTARQVLPDLVIRTGVKKEEILHTSGFMPFQTAYAGWIFLPDLFPDLTPQALLNPIKDFIEYERRFGR